MLKIPIGLITVDETVYAGLAWSSGNSSNYLYTGEYYWTMSPYYFVGENSLADVFRVRSDGNLSYTSVNGTIGVRPVINLKSNIQFSEGNGTSDKPFVVS